MNAIADKADTETVNIEINGTPCKARKGAMIIQVTDAVGVTVPRFCYHDKLPIAANCRMCLVEVERAPKPLPACATPVMEGMKVFTHSPKALAAQRGVMEFLLINHPLDCPICDQGGECELQDLALGFGRGISRFSEKKRVVKDKDVGPLIATDLTRCIHCTRCIRFLDVIAGHKELGATGRGEHMQIGTYIERAIHSELSGNIIDVCPVGALTSKPFRYTARAWELIQQAGVATHDCVGSNVFVHTRQGRVMRVVPRTCEPVNEVWLSDRDRFSYEGLYSQERLQQPLVNIDGRWQNVDWETALNATAQGLQKVIAERGVEHIGALLSPNATLEEFYLWQKLLRGLGCHSIDHRLRQTDFSDQATAPLYPGLGQSIADLEILDAVLLVGSHIRTEQPLLAHRLRKAALRGAGIATLTSRTVTFPFPVSHSIVATPSALVAELAGIALALCRSNTSTAPAGLENLTDGRPPSPTHNAIAEQLRAAGHSAVLLGCSALSSPQLSALRALAGLIAELSGAKIGYLADGANAVGACLAGALPHYGPGGQALAAPGLHARAMLEAPRKAYVLHNIEPEFDTQHPTQAIASLRAADFVVGFTPFVTDTMKNYAHVLLPIAAYAENVGTYVNAEGRWQSFENVAEAVGDARPAWRLLRVLGNLLGVPGFEYQSAGEITAEARAHCAHVPAASPHAWQAPAKPVHEGMVRIADVPPYAVDNLTRRATALQKTAAAQPAAIHINRREALRWRIEDATQVQVLQEDCCATLPLIIDDGIPDGSAYIPAGVNLSARLCAMHGPITLRPAP